MVKGQLPRVLTIVIVITTLAITKAVHDLSYTGIKTSVNHRDPAYAQQQHLQPNGYNYQTTKITTTSTLNNIGGDERLSQSFAAGSGGGVYDQQHVQYQPQAQSQQHYAQQQQEGQAQYDGYYQQQAHMHTAQIQQQPQVPLYQRQQYGPGVHNTQIGASGRGSGSGGQRELEREASNVNLNAVTGYHSECPPHHTGSLPYAYDCRRFLNCWKGRGHLQSCGPGTVFNPDTLECDHPEKVVCDGRQSPGDSVANVAHTSAGSAPYRAGRLQDITTTENVAVQCAPGVSGLQPHPSDCSKFLNCANGNVHVQQCGPGTAYSVSMMTCDFKDKVDCSGRGGSFSAAATVISTTSTTNTRVSSHSVATTFGGRDGKAFELVDGGVIRCPTDAAGHISAHPTDCTKFLNCAHGTAFVQDCGPGTAFDAVHLVCDFKDRVNCGDRESLEFSGKTTHTQVAQTRPNALKSDLLCPANVTGHFAHPFDFSVFLNCKNGQTAVQNCMPQMAFSISRGMCDSREHVAQTDRVTYIVTEVSYEYCQLLATCPPGTQGVHLYPFDGAKYVKCLESGELLVHSCQPNEAFSYIHRRCLPRQQLSSQEHVRYLHELLTAVTSTTSTTNNLAANYHLGVNSGSNQVYCPVGFSGTYPYPFDSMQYIKCTADGRLQVEKCASGHVFSLSLKKCQLKEQLNANDWVAAQYWSRSEDYNFGFTSQFGGYLVCPPGVSGIFLHPFDCTKFMECRADGSSRVDTCPSGSVYSISRKSCIVRDQVEAYDRVEYRTETRNEFSSEAEQHEIYTDGAGAALACTPGKHGFYPHPLDISKYFHCTKDGRAIVESCLAGMVFSISRGYCDFGSRVGASDRSIYARNQQNLDQHVQGSKLTTTTTTTTSGGRIPVECPAHYDGQLPHPYDCSKFLVCSTGKATEIMDCGPGTAYQVDLQVCDFKEKVVCEGRTLSASGFGSGIAVSWQNHDEKIAQRIACPEQMNGFFVHPFDQTKYFICQNGRTVIQSCNDGSVFSISHRMCAPLAEVDVTDRVVFMMTYVIEMNVYHTQQFGYIACPSTATGLFLYPFDCGKFIRCEAGRTLVKECPPNSHFSISKQACLRRNQVERVDRVNTISEIQDLYGYMAGEHYDQHGRIICPPGINGFYPHPYDCHKYLDCSNGRTLVQQCPAGMVFSLSKNLCDIDSQILANDRANQAQIFTANLRQQTITSGATAPLGLSWSLDGAPICPPESSGMYAHPGDCKKFINCANGVTFVMDCGPGTAWNAEMEVCDFLHNVDCGKLHGVADIRQNGIVGAHGIKCPVGATGLWPHPFYCTMYLSCSNENAVVKTCGPGTAWNAERQLCDNIANVDCGGRYADASTSYQDRDGKAWVGQQQQPFYNAQSHQQHSTTSTTNQRGQGEYADRWTSMNRPRPDAARVDQGAHTQVNNNQWAASEQHLVGQTATTIVKPSHAKTEENWVGTGAAINKQSPTQSVLVQEGSLWPSHNVVDTSKMYNTPLAPFASSSAHFNSTHTTNVYYAPAETAESVRQDIYSQRQNYSRGTSGSWDAQSQAVYGKPYTPLPNQNLMPPRSDPSHIAASEANRRAHVVDGGQLLVHEHTDYQGSGDQYASGSAIPIGRYPQLPSSGSINTHTTVSDESNLYGGMQPPAPTQPQNFDLRTQMLPPLQHTPPVSAAQNVRTEVYPPIKSTDSQNFGQNPHYSPAYSGVAHSFNSSWGGGAGGIIQATNTRTTTTTTTTTNLASEMVGTPLADFATLATVPTTEKLSGKPPAYNRHYYNSGSTVMSAGETDKHEEKLPISEALRMLLRPYINRSGTVDEQTAGRAESHIMQLVGQPEHTQQEEVEIIQAGEQRNLATTSTSHTRRQEESEIVGVVQEVSESDERPFGKQKHRHTLEFHQKHPHIPNPFSEKHSSTVDPSHFRPNHLRNHHHSVDYHKRNPHLPNPFESTTPITPQRSTTRRTSTSTEVTDFGIDLRNLGERSADQDCFLACGNGKCAKKAEICDGVNNCGDRSDESNCQHLGYEIRLTGGESANEGRIEVKILGKWGYVCDDKFGLRDADVVCRELGFHLGASAVRGNSFYAPSEAPLSTAFVMDEVECNGNETHIRDCDFKGWGVHNCGADEVAGVVCKVPQMKCPNNYWLCTSTQECIPPAFVCDNTPDCADKSDESDRVCNAPVEYRLEGGRSLSDGRLEVRYRGEWGTVCDDDFGLKEARVACNSLGYYGEPQIVKNIHGPGEGPIWLDQVSCFGNETQLDACSHWTWGEHNCNHTEDVGLKCTVGPPPRKQLQSIPSDHNDDWSDAAMLEDIGVYQSNSNSQSVERSSKLLRGGQRRCGHHKPNMQDEFAHPQQRVVNGTVAQRGRHPWQATIRTRGRGGISSHWCGAVLISKKHLLTAAHCLSGYPKGAYFIRLGDHYANIVETTEVDSYIENWYVHEKFRDGTHMNNDIALVVLKSPIKFNDYVQPICLPEKGAVLTSNRLCTISGWGSIKSGVSTPSNVLRAAQLPIIGDDVCKQHHVYGPDAITEGMFCGGYIDENVDACDGDSGGPFVCSDDDGDTLYGIISWGQHCGYANKPGVYVRVEKYIDWIYDKINLSMQRAQ